MLLAGAILFASAGAETAHGQTGRAQITILEHDGAACRQEAARGGRDRPRGWYCLRGLVRHPAGVASVVVGTDEASLRTDSAGVVQFTGVTDMGDDGGEITVVVRASNGELSEGLYRLTPTPPNPAYPTLQPFSITNLRPRLLGHGDDAAPAAQPPRVAAAPAAAGTGVPGAAAGAAPDSGTAPAGVVVPAIPVTEDAAGQFIQILEPREWSGVGTRGITMPGRRSLRVIGFASHPGGVAAVEIDGRAAAIRAEGGGSYRFMGFVPADSAAREVVVLVRGRSGNPVIARYQLNATPADRTFASRDEAWSPTSGFRGRRWAVVVGVSAYEDSTIVPLRYADADARAIYQFLRSPRAGGGGYAEENIKLLLNEEATYAGLRNALFSFLRQATDEDHVVIYFAGHGAPDPARPGDLYLLTHDTRSGQIPATAFPMRDVDRAVGELYARHVVVITDACHSGGVTGELATRGGTNSINDIFLAQLSSSTGGLAVFTASGADQVSLEDERWGGGHGVFTHYLLQALDGAADEDGDGIVTLVEMMFWTIDRVRRETENAQIPSIGHRTYDRYLPMSLVLEADELAALQPSAVPAPAAARPAGPAPLRPSLADSLARAREAVELFPGSAQYRSRLGGVLLRAGMRDEALGSLGEAVRLDPASAEFRAALALALRDGGDADAALPHLQEALRLDGQNARYHHEHGATLLALQRVDEALGAFRRAVRLDASSAAYHASLGDALRRAGRTREAVTSLRTAVELDGASAVYRRDLALALVADGKAPEAIVEMQEAIARDSASAAYHVDLSTLLRAVGDTGGARAALTRAVRMDSANARYRLTLGELLEEAGMQYEAVMELRAAVRLDSANALYRHRHGLLLTRSDQPDAALAELRAAVRLAPDEAEYRHGLGQALRAAGRPGEALEELIQATRLAPSDPRYHYDLGMLYVEAGRHADALAALEEAARLDPENGGYATALRDARRRAPR